MQVRLGTRVQDIVTGYAGRATARTTYLDGHERYLVEAHVQKEGDGIREEWVDAERLRELDGTVVDLGASPGGASGGGMAEGVRRTFEEPRG